MFYCTFSAFVFAFRTSFLKHADGATSPLAYARKRKIIERRSPWRSSPRLLGSSRSRTSTATSSSRRSTRTPREGGGCGSRPPSIPGSKCTHGELASNCERVHILLRFFGAERPLYVRKLIELRETAHTKPAAQRKYFLRLVIVRVLHCCYREKRTVPNLFSAKKCKTVRKHTQPGSAPPKKE